MFKEQELINAVKIQRLSYSFLTWLSEQLDNGRMTLSTNHGDIPFSEVIFDWVDAHYDFLPMSIRPEKEDMKAFSNYFASYLTTSFDIEENPEQGILSSTGCFCEVCTYIGNLPHLRIKSPDKLDKIEAKDRRTEIIQELAVQEGINLSYSICKEMANSEQYRRDAAYLAYAKSLLERIQSSTGGVYMLVLWREIAWENGAPIKGFTLEAEEILKAEQKLKNRLKLEKRGQETI